MVTQGVLGYDDFKVEGQMGSRALKVLVRAQEIVSDRGSYRYVEIGSYLGRTLQPHLQDKDCKKVLSIDLRPDVTPDERKMLRDYQGITAEDMVTRLAEHVGTKDLGKLETVTDTSGSLRTRSKREAPFELALIDGEHTVTAAFCDFLNLLPRMRPNGMVLFDDTSVILPAIQNAIAMLQAEGRPAAAFFGVGGISAIALGEGAEETVDAFGPDLTIGLDKAFKRHRERSISATISTHLARTLRHNPGNRRRAAKILTERGYRVTPPTEEQAAE